MSNKPIGSIVWQDLTVHNADEVKDFYKQVVGWNSEEHDMGDYADYNMIIPNTDSPLTGICHKRGTNQNIPTQWLMYVRVQEVTESANLCTKLGGEIVDGPRLMGQSMFCVIKDPAGAVLALISYE